MAACCLLGAGFGAVIFYSSSMMVIQSAVPDQLRGRIMGIWMIVYSGSVPLGALWTGRAAQTWGVALVMGVSAALCLVTGLLVWASGVLVPPPIQPAAGDQRPARRFGAAVGGRSARIVPDRRATASMIASSTVSDQTAGWP